MCLLRGLMVRQRAIREMNQAGWDRHIEGKCRGMAPNIFSYPRYSWVVKAKFEGKEYARRKKFWGWLCSCDRAGQFLASYLSPERQAMLGHSDTGNRATVLRPQKRRPMVRHKFPQDFPNTLVALYSSFEPCHLSHLKRALSAPCLVSATALLHLDNFVHTMPLLLHVLLPRAGVGGKGGGQILWG